MPLSACIDLSTAQQRRLLAIARESIIHGLDTGRPLPLSEDELAGPLGSRLASFVTLRKRDALRGCMGTLEPVRPLAEDVAVAARNAALRDPRFPPLRPDELDQIVIEVSVLSAKTPLVVRSESELLQALVPREDGLLLEDATHRATFLPKVWESLAEPVDFVRALKIKAGLSPDHPVETLHLHRYRTISFAEEPALESAID